LRTPSNSRVKFNTCSLTAIYEEDFTFIAGPSEPDLLQYSLSRLYTRVLQPDRPETNGLPISSRSNCWKVSLPFPEPRIIKNLKIPHIYQAGEMLNCEQRGEVEVGFSDSNLLAEKGDRRDRPAFK
jgi:hypothetical protein